MVTTNVQLTKPLGQGAMGCVWVADHLTLRTQVAVKFISNELASDNHEILARFEQEASVAAQIKSPHVVQTFDQGVMTDGTPYIVMELLDGETMGERLERTGRLSLRQTGQVVGQVARVLRKAHELGIVHRDIKPDNIFLTTMEEGVFCKLLDFGIAKQTQLPKMGGLTNPGVMIGTPEFMSPEQVLSAKDVDYRADMWALAVTAYYALTGHLPFTADVLGALCVALLNAEFVPASELRPELPAEFDAWFAKALHKNPAERFDNAREMALAFVQHVPQHGDDIETALVNSSAGIMTPPGRQGTHVGMGDDDGDTGSNPRASLAEMYWDDEPHKPLSTAAPVASSATLTGSSASLPRSTVISGQAQASRARLAVGGAAVALAAVVAILVGLSLTGSPPQNDPEDQKSPAARAADANSEVNLGTSPTSAAPSRDEQPTPATASPSGDADTADTADTANTANTATSAPSNSTKFPPVSRPPRTPRVPNKSKVLRHDHGF